MFTHPISTLADTFEPTDLEFEASRWVTLHEREIARFLPVRLQCSSPRRLPGLKMTAKTAAIGQAMGRPRAPKAQRAVGFNVQCLRNRRIKI